MSYYRVVIRLGSLVWDIVTDETVPSPDEDEILDSLSFGWSMPDRLWPQQPDPMTATLAINVPDFTTDVSELEESDPCSIQVFLVDGDPVSAAFYGRITDLEATPRAGRTGVTLSVVAVDYTADLAEAPQYVNTDMSSTYTVTDVLEEAWTAGDLGDFPAWPAAFADINIVYPSELRQPGDVIAEHLAQTIDDNTRIILSPHIVVDEPDPLYRWHFDIIDKDPGSVLNIEGRWVETSSLKWQFQKGNGPTRVEAVGYNQTPENVAIAEHAGVTKHVRESISIPSVYDIVDAQNVADFYLPPDTVSRWRLQSFRYFISQHVAADDLEEISPVLFPKWKDSVTNPFDRAACYGAVIRLTDVPGHLSPFADDPEDLGSVEGRLAGVTLTINRKQVYLDMQLRQTVEGP